MTKITLLTVGTMLALAAPSRAADALPKPTTLTIAPAEFSLQGTRARQVLLVTAGYGDQGNADLTDIATYESLPPNVAIVRASGVVTPRADGPAESWPGLPPMEARARVTVHAMAEPSLVDFRTDVIAAISRAGCNQGSCHGSPQGKNGFRLSLRGFDPDLDFRTLTRELAGRRINLLTPDDSLILLKGSGRIKHQGSVAYHRGDPAYRAVRQWIAEGGKPSAAAAPRLIRLEVLPEARRLHTASPRQQLAVRAHFEGGASRDVTDLAVFTSNDPYAAPVSAAGLVQFRKTAETAILVRYLDQFASTRLTYVRRDPDFAFKAPAPANFIDEHVFAKQRELQLASAPLAPDHVFLRRVFLDLIGTLPTEAEAREFLDSKDPDRRQADRSPLERDEYASFWALKWADVLRGSPATITERGTHSFHRYLVRTFAADRPMDAFARELLTGLGNTLHKPAANFYRISRTPDEAAETVAQLFLGVRLQCAKCHNHPFESISQTDYYGLAAYFARVQRKTSPFGLDDEIVYLGNGGEVQHPDDANPAARGIRRRGRQARPDVTVASARRLADQQGQSLLRAVHRQPHLVSHDGPRHRRSGGRFPRHQSAIQPATAEGVDGRVHSRRLSHQADPPRHRQLACLSAGQHRRAAAVAARRRPGALLHALRRPHAFRGADHRRDLAGHGRSRIIQGLPRRHPRHRAGRGRRPSSVPPGFLQAVRRAAMPGGGAVAATDVAPAQQRRRTER